MYYYSAICPLPICEGMSQFLNLGEGPTRASRCQEKAAVLRVVVTSQFASHQSRVEVVSPQQPSLRGSNSKGTTGDIGAGRGGYTGTGTMLYIYAVCSVTMQSAVSLCSVQCAAACVLSSAKSEHCSQQPAAATQTIDTSSAGPRRCIQCPHPPAVRAARRSLYLSIKLCSLMIVASTPPPGCVIQYGYTFFNSA